MGTRQHEQSMLSARVVQLTELQLENPGLLRVYGRCCCCNRPLLSLLLVVVLLPPPPSSASSLSLMLVTVVTVVTSWDIVLSRGGPVLIDRPPVPSPLDKDNVRTGCTFSA